MLTADAGDTGRETVTWEASIADISAVAADSSALEAESAGKEEETPVNESRGRESKSRVGLIGFLLEKLLALYKGQR